MLKVTEMSSSAIHNHQHTENGSHTHGGLLGKNSELIFSIVCGALLAIGYLLSDF